MWFRLICRGIGRAQSLNPGCGDSCWRGPAGLWMRMCVCSCTRVALLGCVAAAPSCERSRPCRRTRKERLGTAEKREGRSAAQVAANLGVAGRIIVLDRLPFAELQRFTAACDAGILLYPNDGVGNYYQAPGRLTQYLACGLPVLASDFPGLELLILKHELGVVCNPACPTSIARGVSVLLEGSAEQRQCRATRLRTTVMTELCYDRFAGQIEQAVHRASTGW